jgi:Zn finger protein HypA/HybF involved in hydrogenase expression
MTIAREIAEHVTRAAQKAEAKKVVAVELELGDLAFFDTAALEMWLHQALEDGLAKGAEISIDVVESALTCKDCGFPASRRFRRTTTTSCRCRRPGARAAAPPTSPSTRRPTAS